MNPDTELHPEAFTIPCLSSVQPTQFTQVSPMVQLCLGDTHTTIYQQESPGQPQTTHTYTHTLEIVNSRIIGTLVKYEQRRQ